MPPAAVFRHSMHQRIVVQTIRRSTPPCFDMSSPAGADFDNEWKKIQLSLGSGGFDLRKLLPRPRASGDKDEDGRNQRVYQAKVNMMCLMNTASHHQVLDWVAEAESKVRAETRVHVCGEFWKEGTYMCAKIDTAWRMNFLATHFSHVGLSLDLLTKVDHHDKNGVAMLMDYLAAIGPATRIPEVCLNKAICAMWLRKRILQLGRCTQEKIRDGPLATDGMLHWASSGVFRFRQVTGAPTKVVHVDGAEVDMPANFVLDASYHLQDNHSDQQAAIVMGSLTPIKIRSFFPKNLGPNTAALMNKKSCVTSSLALEAAAEHELSQRATAAAKSREQEATEAAKANETDRKRIAASKRAPAPPLAQKKRRATLGQILRATT